MTRRRGLRLLLHRAHLLISAWRLHGAARGLISGRPWDAVRRALLQAPWLPRGTAPEDAIWAAARTASVGQRLLGRRDTCLLRTLVAGTLIADRPDVAVRVGVRRPGSTGDLLDAHAWLTVGGTEIAVPGGSSRFRFEEVTALGLERAR